MRCSEHRRTAPQQLVAALHTKKKSPKAVSGSLGACFVRGSHVSASWLHPLTRGAGRPFCPAG
jgi:hypothetical protein